LFLRYQCILGYIWHFLCVFCGLVSQRSLSTPR
jgi:hypothetical protein